MAVLRPATDTAAAAWIVDGLRSFGESVQSLLPASFAAYVRVFHPAYRHAGTEWTPVRWTEIAAASGMRAHAGMQLCAITGKSGPAYERQPSVYDQPPETGSLPPDLTRPLAAALARHTAAPEPCWFAVWSGFAVMRDEACEAPIFRVPGRVYHLLTGSLEAVTESTVAGRLQSPNLWWPNDHAWCVATDIDLNSTYIGCSGACRDDLLAITQLETLPIDPATGIDWKSDRLNPQPTPARPDA